MGRGGSVGFDSGRRDRRMGDFLKQAEEVLGERLHAADAERLHKLAGHDRHQGIVALAEKMTVSRTITEVIEDVEGTQDKPLFLVLDGVTDPHNFGACLRVADGAGVDAVVIPKDRSASINATVSKVSSGASEVIPVLTVTNLVRSMREMQEERERREWCLRMAKREGDAEITAGVSESDAEVLS